jgi:hypothetical protein
MAHRDKWTAELGKALEHLPQEVRDFVRAPDSDSALLGALLACLERSGQTPPGVAADPLGGGVGVFAETAEEPEAEAADPLSGGLRGGTTRKRAAEEPLFGQGKHKAPKAAGVLTLSQQARKEQEAGLQRFEAFLAKGEPTAAEAAAAVQFLSSLEQQKFRFGVGKDLVQGGLFVLAYTSAKFPEEHKSEEVDQLVSQLEGPAVPEGVQQALLEKEAQFFAHLFPAEQLLPLAKALVTVCNALNPKHTEIQSILDLLGQSIRVLLGLPAPIKYQKQKASSWQTDVSKALAVAAAATRGTYHYLLLPEQGAVAEAAEAVEVEEASEEELTEDLSAALAP